MEPVIPGEGAEILNALRVALAESDFDQVTFGFLSGEKPGTLKVDAVIDVNDPRLMNVSYWEAGFGAGWFSVEGRAYRVPGLEDAQILGLPDDLSGHDLLLLNDAAGQLRNIHEVAARFLENGYAIIRTTVCETLDDVAEETLAYEEEDEDEAEDLEPWEEYLREFTGQCRLGLFGGLSVDESTEVPGAVNISAFVMDLDGDEPIELKVYWQPEEGSIAPAHWIAAGNTAAKESDNGTSEAFYQELLVGREGPGREHLEHALMHLHELAHTATEIIMMKANRPWEVVAEAQLDHTPSDEAMEAMSATEVSDALAGLNGIARLYTGSRPLDFGNRGRGH